MIEVRTPIEVPYLNLATTDDSSSYLDSDTAFNHLAGNSGAVYLISFLTVCEKNFSGRKPPPPPEVCACSEHWPWTSYIVVIWPYNFDFKLPAHGVSGSQLGRLIMRKRCVRI
jgi:hypothetical protein